MILQTILLGALQGITEFLPVSSSGHLVFLPYLAGWDYQGLAFDVLVHTATLVAIIFVFRKIIWQLIKGFFAPKKLPKENRLAWFLIVATIPAGLAGYFLADLIEAQLHTPKIVAIGLLVGSVFLWGADYLLKKNRKPITDVKKINIKQALLIGLAQVIALIPGISRSGVTMSAAVSLGASRKTAAEFSFLLGAPVFFGASLFQILDLIEQGKLRDFLSLVNIIGFFVALIMGILAIRVLLKFLQTKTFKIFIIYRILLGILILGMLVV